jgi:hypothetical protein
MIFFFIPRSLVNLLTFPGFFLHDHLQSVICERRKLKYVIGGLKELDDFTSGKIIEVDRTDFENNKSALIYFPLFTCSGLGVFLFFLLTILVEHEFQKLSLLTGWFAISVSFHGYIFNGVYNTFSELLKVLGSEIFYVFMIGVFGMTTAVVLMDG